MRPVVRRGFCIIVSTAFWAVCGWASPLSNPLLALVPPGAQVVAGFDNHPTTHGHGRLLLTTHNNRLDLDDWQALTGADTQRVFDEVVEVAVAPAPSGTALSEHLLLVEGRFDRKRIFGSLQENGAAILEYAGLEIVLIKPLARERGDMLDDRWLAILDNRTGLFGTPWLVQQALRRAAEHAVPDSILEERLSLLHRDVTSWNVLANSSTTAESVTFMQPRGSWAQLQEDADVLMVGARFGSRIRIDFSIHADAARGRDFFARKAGFFASALGTGADQGSPDTDRPEHRLTNFSLESNRVQGSVEMSMQQFEAWCDHIYLAQAAYRAAALTGN